MANKTYTVMKDGEELKELKTLAAAKKLADAEDAEVFCEGLCVYQGTVKDSEDTVSELSDAVAESPAKEPVTPVKYTLTAKMNIRKAPSKTAEIAGIAQKGTIVDARHPCDHRPGGEQLHLHELKLESAEACREGAALGHGQVRLCIGREGTQVGSGRA